jgi:hypothetical protein
MMHPVFAISAKLRALEFMVRNPKRWLDIRNGNIESLLKELNEDAGSIYSEDDLAVLRTYLESIPFVI